MTLRRSVFSLFVKDLAEVCRKFADHGKGRCIPYRGRWQVDHRTMYCGKWGSKYVLSSDSVLHQAVDVVKLQIVPRY